LRIPPGAIVGIIGPNGAGKSTIFRMISGKEQPDAGKITIGHTVQMAVVDQSRDRCPTTRPCGRRSPAGRHPDRRQVRDAVARLPRPLQLQGRRPAEDRGAALRRRARPAAPREATLLKGGNVLLLDEPSNDLDVETLRALEDALLEFAGTALVISHDRWFLDRIATHILAAEGDSQWAFFAGNYHDYEADKRRRLGEEAAKPHRIRYKALM
jgi:sulfate-transporting ATPase